MKLKGVETNAVGAMMGAMGGLMGAGGPAISVDAPANFDAFKTAVMAQKDKCDSGYCQDDPPADVLAAFETLKTQQNPMGGMGMMGMGMGGNAQMMQQQQMMMMQQQQMMAGGGAMNMTPQQQQQMMTQQQQMGAGGMGGMTAAQQQQMMMQNGMQPNYGVQSNTMDREIPVVAVASAAAVPAYTVDKPVEY